MGLEKSGRLITGAAAIMVAVFLAFGLSNFVIIKAIGIGLAVAIAVDATIVRILIVPSVMRILGRANWWAPRPLARLHRRIGAGESRPVVSVPARGLASLVGPWLCQAVRPLHIPSARCEENPFENPIPGG